MINPFRGLFRSKEKPLPLMSDGCGDAYCPRCGRWLSEHHPKQIPSLPERPVNYCPNCGQRVLWVVMT